MILGYLLLIWSLPHYSFFAATETFHCSIVSLFFPQDLCTGYLWPGSFPFPFLHGLFPSFRPLYFLSISH